MIGAEEIAAMAIRLGGSDAADQEQTLLTLGALALEEVQTKLEPERHAPEQAVLCGAAYLALSWLPDSGVSSFTAGNLSVSLGSAGSQRELYAHMAESVLFPYVRSTDFAFLGVEG